MSLLYRRPNSPYWYVTKTRQSTKTANRKHAEEFARKSLTDAWRVDALGESLHTWDELADAWLDAKSHKRSLDDDKRIIEDCTAWLQRREELNTKDLAKITGDTIRQYAAYIKARASAPTANRHLAIIRGMLRIASDWGWLAKVPPIKLYPEPKKEPRWLTPEELECLLERLPPWCADMALLAAQTGMRWGNVSGLRWDWINAAGTVIHVPIAKAKTADTYTVPLSTIARNLLSKLRDARIGAAPYVFIAEGYESPIPHHIMKYRFNLAVDKAGIKRCTFHKLRHTFASWHIQKNTPSRVVQEMGGWQSPAMLERYAHLATDHLTHYADNLNSAGPPALPA